MTRNCWISCAFDNCMQKFYLKNRIDLSSFNNILDCAGDQTNKPSSIAAYWLQVPWSVFIVVRVFQWKMMEIMKNPNKQLNLHFITAKSQDIHIYEERHKFGVPLSVVPLSGNLLTASFESQPGKKQRRIGWFIKVASS